MVISSTKKHSRNRIDMNPLENLTQITMELILEDALSKDEALKMVYGYEEFLNSGLTKQMLYDEVNKAWLKFQ